MLDFRAVFEDKFQHFLKDVDYKVITVDPIQFRVDAQIKDSLQFAIDKGNNVFEFEVRRTLFFAPYALYQLSVAFGAKLTIKKDAPDLNGIDWEAEFKNNVLFVNLISGLMAKISVLISQITSSYGQTPMVTPPMLMN